MGATSIYSANILDLFSSPDGDVYMLDTNAIIYAIGYDVMIPENLVQNNTEINRLQNNYKKFFSELPSNDEYAFYTPIQADEIRTVCQVMVSNRKKRKLSDAYKKKKWNDIYKEFPELIQESTDIYNKIVQALDESDYIQQIDIDDWEEVNSIKDYLLSNYSIETNDAKIIAAAIQCGTINLVSEEKNMGYIPGINLYTGNQTLLTNRINGNKLITFEDTKKVYGGLLKNEDRT